MYVCFILKSKNVSSPKHASFNKCHWECTVADFTYIQLIFNFITHSVCLIGNPFGICQNACLFLLQNAVSMLKQEYKEGETNLKQALQLAVKVLSKTLDMTKLTSEKGECSKKKQIVLKSLQPGFMILLISKFSSSLNQLLNKMAVTSWPSWIMGLVVILS